MIKVGIIGWPVSHSLSPAMHKAAAAALGIDLDYLPLAVRPGELGRAIEDLVSGNFRGVNVTVPHKESVIPYLDSLDGAASAIGAVNTIVIDSSVGDAESQAVLRGYNTDYSGFLAALDALEWEAEAKNCLVLGAGGSARAITYGLTKRMARVAIASRRMEQARSVVRDIHASAGSGAPEALDLGKLAEFCHGRRLDLIVNATPLGMAPHEDQSPWPDGLAFPKNALAYDLVYGPLETTFLKDARSAGCQTINGFSMLIRQGAQSFELWTGKKPDLQIMADALV
jgi:shikimate dehydrogenase